MRQFLKGLDLEESTIDFVMAEHGKLLSKSIEEATTLKTQLADAKVLLKGFEGVDIEALKTELATANDALKAYKDVDVVALKSELETTKTALAEAETKHSEAVAVLQADAQLRESIATLKFTSNYAKNGIYSDLKEKVTFEDGKPTNFDEVLAELREQQPSAFAVDEPPVDPAPGASGGKHNPPPKDPPKKAIPLII